MSVLRHEQVTHKTPDIVPVFKYAAQPETRKRANLSYENKTIQNAPVLSEITRLRDEAAKLLGYKNHAEWVLEVRVGFKFKDDAAAQVLDKGGPLIADFFCRLCARNRSRWPRLPPK